jgi:hypothetical protein
LVGSLSSISRPLPPGRGADAAVPEAGDGTSPGTGCGADESCADESCASRARPDEGRVVARARVRAFSPPAAEFAETATDPGAVETLDETTIVIACRA